METVAIENHITLIDVFERNGFIAAHKPGYELRKEQFFVAETAERAINEDRNALVEAGTGTGKSFALLVPAILSGKRTVVSTETNTLLDQYVLKDLPFLQQVLPVEFTFAKAKGKGNYLCRARVDEYLENPFLDGFADAGEVYRLVEWSYGTNTGDRSEPDFRFSDASWRAVACDELCPRSQCRYYGQGCKGETDCFAYQARKDFLQANIVVTNHTLCLLNASIGGDAVLGSHEVVIFDEAHTLGENAQKTFGFEVKQKTFSSFAKYCARILKQAGMPLEGYDVTGLEEPEKWFFNQFRDVTKQQVTFEEMPGGIVTDAKDASLPVIDLLDALRKELNTKNAQSDEDKKLLDELDDRALSHIKSLKGLFEPVDNWLAYAEIQQANDYSDKRVTLHYKPVDVAPILRDTVYAWRKSTIMASATLTVNRRFDFIVKDLGVENPLCLQVDSPFDYGAQCTGYFPKHLPDPQSPEYHTALAEEIEKLLIHTNGRAFVLFTSNRDMGRVYDLLSGRLKWQIYKQGDYAKPVLIDRFKEDVHSVLFATRSFFTGVDIPGEALSCVILAKAPFRPPDEPLFKAKCQMIKREGGNDFRDYALPLMVNDLRQAFGRLIRSKSDTGVFAFLDSRAINKPYFRVIENSLPSMKVRVEL